GVLGRAEHDARTPARRAVLRRPGDEPARDQPVEVLAHGVDVQAHTPGDRVDAEAVFSLLERAQDLDPALGGEGLVRAGPKAGHDSILPPGITPEAGPSGPGALVCCHATWTRARRRTPRCARAARPHQDVRSYPGGRRARPRHPR